MKKFFYVALIVTVFLTLAGCGNAETASAKSEKTRDLAEADYTEIGNGETYLSTPGGTTEDGNIPVIYIGKEESYLIGLNAWDFNGGALSYVYVDGFLNSKMQLADTQTSIEALGKDLSVGIHTIEVVQYKDDNPESGMITYRIMKYEIKSK